MIGSDKMISRTGDSSIFRSCLFCLLLIGVVCAAFTADRAEAQVRQDVQQQQQIKRLDMQKSGSQPYQPPAPQFAPPVIVQPPEFEEAAPRRRLRSPAPQGMALPRDKEIDQLKGVITQLRESVEKLNKAVEQLTERLPKQ
jgi:hypothetical protein